MQLMVYSIIVLKIINFNQFLDNIDHQFMGEGKVFERETKYTFDVFKIGANIPLFVVLLC